MSLKNARIFRFQNFRLETAGGGLLFLDGKRVALEPQAARVLIYLAENAGRLVSKEELLETIWSDVFTTDDVLKKAVSQIRRVLDDNPQNPRFIETHHRRGYRFIAGITEEIPGGDRQKTDEESDRMSHVVIEDAGDPDFDRCIGRQAEFGILRAEFRRVVRGGGQPILIVGEPSIGKTQLSARFENWTRASESAVAGRIRFFDYEAARTSSYDLFLDLLRGILTGIGENGKKFDVREVTRTRLGVELPEELFNAASSSAVHCRIQSDALRFVVPLS